ncbi:MAG: hypothetical protein AAGE52_13080 [Myxococcota bacterium]
MRLLALLVVFAASPALADDTWSNAEDETWRVEAVLTFHRFESQVKTEIGGTTVDPVVEEGSVGLAVTATYNVWRFFRLGLYAQLDGGQRQVGRFEGIDADGDPIVTREGGRFLELWLGPVLRVQWRGLFGEFAYGALGIRRDRARTDLPNEDGEGGLFRVSPRVAWSFGVGAFVPVHPNVDVVLRMQYRVRYYDQRGGEDLTGGVVHGTQNLAPFLGVAWHRSR